MRKSIFILAALFTATFANAQIYLEKTINGAGAFPCWLDPEGSYFDCGKLPIVYGDTLVELYNDDMTLYKTIRFAASNNSVRRAPTALKGGPSFGMYFFSRNIFTTDGKIAFVKWSNDNITIYDEDKNLIADLQNSDDSFGIITVNGHYKFIIAKSEWTWDNEAQTGTAEYTTYIYSLPGNGDTSEGVSTPSAPRKSSARKYLRNDQVLVENADHTYTLTGQEVK